LFLLAANTDNSQGGNRVTTGRVFSGLDHPFRFVLNERRKRRFASTVNYRIGVLGESP